MFHHNILSRDHNETIHKIYTKQREEYTKRDWYQLLIKDFDFIGIDMNEDDIKRTSKEDYKNKMLNLIKNAGFKYFMQQKETHKKLDQVEYTELKIQAYLKSRLLSNKEKKLLYLLRSRCYDVKYNFKRMHKNDIQCRFGCLTPEDQNHALLECQPLNTKHKQIKNIEYSSIFSSLSKQLEAIKFFKYVDQWREHMKDHILPGGCCQDPCKFNSIVLVDYSTDLPL